jgi:general secretion pathway protein H
MQRQRGLTLLELLVVLAIIAISTAGVALAIRDSAQTQIEREAQRLIAKLEAARVQSRAQGVPLIWRVTDSGFVLETLLLGAGFVAQNEDWLTAGMSAEISANVSTANGARNIALGPEPIISPASITLHLASSATSTSKGKPLRLRIETDGLQPFHQAP